MDQTYLRRPDSAPKLYTAPVVTLKAVTAIADDELWSSIWDATNPSYTTREGDRPIHADGEYLIEFGGRACYQSFHNPAGRTTDNYIRNIIDQGHYSVLEHASVSYYLEGVSRSLTHELIRHRHLSYSQLSQRFVDPSTAAYVAPPLVCSDSSLFKQWASAIDVEHDMWQGLMKMIDDRHPNLTKKQRREAARSLAPGCTETKILVTGNLRAWREVLSKRWSTHAEAEIDRVMDYIYQSLIELYPSVFSDIVRT